ncbi:uncharacterized protein K452DRAFT_307338 [Aplosporella prunicola CBS 121167]|uniref:Uncharacterized protein n=1 Tax=Aplosporella prunicola CBS 121167 TaxID=1176127 RepID=A0A6A6BG97_9PEZI|nr:uncharacterized protein K452DRAFT_307338 [Aplosporella prunicola CBS 121167]KAF2143159.1 hypothetical protein K452DRAFT_307338 [Aplosporella prunicola CBS 121167]
MSPRKPKPQHHKIKSESSRKESLSSPSSLTSISQSTSSSSGSASDDNPPDTDPYRTHDLWEQVAAVNPTDLIVAPKPPTAPKAPSDPKAPSTMSKPLSPDTTDMLGTPEFEAILALRGIKVLDDVRVAKTQDVWQHFGTSLPDAFHGNEPAYYKNLPGVQAERIWLTTDDKTVQAIVDEWAALRELNASEHGVAVYEHLLKRECRRPVSGSGTNTKDTGFVPERAIMHAIAPKSKEPWHAPPLLDTDDAVTPDTAAAAALFDIRPGATYFLSPSAFDARTWAAAADYIHLAPPQQLLAPYFTVSHAAVSAPTAHLTAAHTIALAAAIALYNRFRLHRKRLQIRQEVHVDAHALRHYGLSVAGADYAVWCARVRVSPGGDWEGCTVRRVARGSMLLHEQVRECVRWVDEVHRWGLGVWAEGVREDAGVCVGRGRGGVGGWIAGGGGDGGGKISPRKAGAEREKDRDRERDREKEREKRGRGTNTTSGEEERGRPVKRREVGAK